MSKQAGRGAYHDIETLLVPVALHDILEVVEAPDGKTRLFLSGLPIPGEPHANLCLQAYRLLHQVLLQKNDAFRGMTQAVQEANEPHLPRSQDRKGQEALPPVHIHLHKQVPVGGGLGGGSANGAFMLELLQRMFSLALSREQMHELASTLGSDCPFFLHQSAMLATGRGSRLEAIPIPSIQKYQIAIITPPIHISTKEAYAVVKPRKGRKPLEEILSRGVGHWHVGLTNDFEEPLFATYPILPRIKEGLLERGAAYASLSGSGASLYGLFDADIPGKALERDFPSCRIIQTKALI